jgi:Asp-tRNA(Asn)/Glu-tRNA(Gln) amidotransferase C subunit
LNISGNRNLDFSSDNFISITKQLTHLDISKCNLDSQSIEIIIGNVVRLESLNLNDNESSDSFGNFKNIQKSKNLKILKMCKCKLNFNNLASILNTFESIEEIDLSQNDFSEYQENILGNHKDLLTDENSYNLTNTVQAGDLSFSKKLLYLK